MRTLVIVLIVVAVLAAVAYAGWTVQRNRRRAALRARWGAEWDQAVAATGSEQAAERELQERARRRASYSIRELTAEERERYTSTWQTTQARFVDDPVGAVAEADSVLGRFLRDLGYPVGEQVDSARVAADLSVDHADVVGCYRSAHDVADRSGEATTEELRRAMRDYKSVMDRLMR